jgi:hypothetical protein
VLDVGTVATNAWQWIEERRLMTRAALDRLGVEVELDAGDDFVPLQGPARRR